MTLEEFREVVRRRIPTAEEFVSVVEGQGWRVVAFDDGRASLRCRNPNDSLALALAKMLGREPYRTNVLKVVGKKSPASPAPPPLRLREWFWPDGHYYVELGPIPAAGQPRHDGRHPDGATWWRWQGETEWRPVPNSSAGDIDSALGAARKKGVPL